MSARNTHRLCFVLEEKNKDDWGQLIKGARQMLSISLSSRAFHVAALPQAILIDKKHASFDLTT